MGLKLYLSTNIRDSHQSFQYLKPTNRLMVAMAGVEIGTIIWIKTRKFPDPFILAESYIHLGLSGSIRWIKIEFLYMTKMVLKKPP